MIKIIFLNLLFLLPMVAYSQQEEVLTKKEQKAFAKEERKARKAAEEEQMKKITHAMIVQKRFVMEADYVSNNRGVRLPVNSSLNFIAVDSSEGVIQLSTLSGSGYNGVGGITVEGRITDYKVDSIPTKSGLSYNLKILIMTSMGTYDIFFMISPTGYTDATIQGTTRGMLRYTGNLIPVGLSKVYKGTPSY